MDGERESFSWSLFVVGVSFKLGRNCQMDFRCDWFLALNFIPLSSLVIYLFLTFSTTSLSLTSSAPIKLLIWNLPPVIQDEWLMPSSPSSLWFLSWSLEFILLSMDNPVTRIKCIMPIVLTFLQCVPLHVHITAFQHLSAWNHWICLTRHWDIFQPTRWAKTFSFSDPNRVGFVPKP